jgi:allantoinase
VAVDLLIHGGIVVGSNAAIKQDVAVDKGVITALDEELHLDAKEVIDATNLYLMPGLIDAHVHFNEPGRNHWEGFATGSAGLAAGGGTLFIDMPLNSTPPLLDRDTFVAKCRAAEAATTTDFAFWGGLTPDNLEHLPELAELGVVGFKAFMSDSGIAEFKAVDDLSLLEGMRIAAELDLPVMVHAESDTLTRALTWRIRSGGGGSARDYLASRPILAELEAIQRALLFAEETGARLHLAHVSSAKGIALASKAKANGVQVSCETCPHYLHFDEDALERLGAIAKCAPPLRPNSERRGLWRALLAGKIDLIASDHSPCPPELKEAEDFFEAWGGVAGVQSTLGVLLSNQEQEGLSLQKIASLGGSRSALRQISL